MKFVTAEIMPGRSGQCMSRIADRASGVVFFISVVTVLCQCPCNVFANDTRGVIGPPRQRTDNFVRRLRIAQGYRNVSQPSLIADPAYCTARGFFQKLLLGPIEQSYEVRVIQTVSYGEIVFNGSLCKLIPWAHQLTIVATVNSVAQGFSKLLRNTALEFDSEVRDASARIELIRADNGLCWTDIQTGATRTAVILCRRVNG